MKNKIDLLNELKLLKNAKRVYRDAATDFVIQNPEVCPYLLELVFEQNKTAIKSAWVLELVCEKNLLFIQQHLDYFIKNIYKIKHESALRPISKICSFIARSYDNGTLQLTENQKETIIESNFDFIIENHKVATQVYAMDTLYILGKEYDWVHVELKLILEKNTSKGSAGYQAHAKKILKDLN